MLRRHLWRWAAPALLALAATTALALPGAASATSVNQGGACIAIYPRPASCSLPAPSKFTVAGPTYVGWAYLDLGSSPSCPACQDVRPARSVPAYNWTGTGWVPAALPDGWAYIAPYSGDWRWAWTQGTGWLAVHGQRFDLRHLGPVQYY